MFKHKHYFNLKINTGITVVANPQNRQELVNAEHAWQLVIQSIDKGIIIT